jgi:hypothetical protein
VTQKHINLVKLCVGIDSLEQLRTYRADSRIAAHRREIEDISTHVTRMWPKRAAELLNGGSLYWVIKGVILARQQILRLDETIGPDGIRRCAIVMSPEIIQTQAAPRRPFQGWRYLEQRDSPPDLAVNRFEDDALPDAMNLALAEIGLR